MDYGGRHEAAQKLRSRVERGPARPLSACCNAGTLYPEKQLPRCGGEIPHRNPGLVGERSPGAALLHVSADRCLPGPHILIVGEGR